MTTYNTGNPLGSAAAKDLYDNAENFDHLSNDQSNEKWPDRFGRERLTWHGIEKMSQEAISSFGYITLKSFQLGAPLPNNELTLPNQALQDETDGEYYRWDGVFPKAVPAGSTPESTGGIGVGKWLSVGDAAFREEANKKYKYSVKLSDYLTLQESASAAVDGLLIDEDYHFTDGESVDFSGKVLTIDCKAKFIGDGKLTFENLGSGSRIVHPHMQSQTVPYVISRWDSNGEWINDPSTIISTLTQSRTKGYAPTTNDVDIYSSLPDNVKNQNLISHLIISNSSGIDIFYPKATFGSYESFKNNNVKFWYPRDFYGDMTNCIAFTAWDSTDYYHGNYVIGGSTNYGSGSGVCFYRNDGGVSRDGGVIGGFTPYRCGESGVKTYQNEVNGISQRCYSLRFIDIYPIETYYDGVDLNADYGTPTERQHDYTLAQYGWNNLPTNHIVSNIQAYKTHGVGIWGDGSTGFYRDIYASYSRGAGIFIKGSGKNFKNLTSVQNNAANTPGENQITLDGANIIDGVNIINYTQPPGLAIFAPNSTVTNLSAPGVSSSSINIGNIEGLVVGNQISVQPNLATQTSAVYLNVVNTGVASKREDTIKVGPGASEVTRYVISGSTPRLTMRENHGDFGAVNIAFSGTVLPDEAVPDANSYAVYWDGTNLTALINHGGVLTRQKLTT
ncbi:TPA: tail spike protein [Salmonella enterica subsp. enterica serovar Javiana]|uniref:Phage tail protein n=1 Tax=Salmonella enterica TaxID=28901 RepID=A0A755VPL0_SALER|nr:tail spike protein [Salmonella enterica]EFN6540621.1 phage tail protein [Salmonella enterica subsp. enterica serovar Typhimurium]EKR2133399.1 phage tail protein [Salmonella enterica subsp. enterica serovar Javiana]EEQ0674077.1 phage tail protein [Salmonella enterica]EGA9980081.1 phage tail protein [Salmonella enterica]EGK6472961.1 phage tail protein [Salmonella enterica]